ncbi:LOB domain-containing protein 35 [Raphanus sativus]|nr:LOB domain-containing protein 35 [Raphanus sativus]
MDLPICAVCKFAVVGPCTLGNECIMAPYFPSTEPDKFDRVNKVFGILNVYKILRNLEEPWQREYAANALCYEAEARIQDPICGYVGVQLVLENKLNNLKRDIDSALNELMITKDKVPQYFNLPIPSDFAEPSLFSLINEMLELNEDQKNQRTRLPDVDAQRNVDEIVGMRENDQGDVHRADGASTSSGPPHQNQP